MAFVVDVNVYGEDYQFSAETRDEAENVLSFHKEENNAVGRILTAEEYAAEQCN